MSFNLQKGGQRRPMTRRHSFNGQSYFVRHDANSEEGNNDIFSDKTVMELFEQFDVSSEYMESGEAALNEQSCQDLEKVSDRVKDIFNCNKPLEFDPFYRRQILVERSNVNAAIKYHIKALNLSKKLLKQALLISSKADKNKRVKMAQALTRKISDDLGLISDEKNSQSYQKMIILINKKINKIIRKHCNTAHQSYLITLCDEFISIDELFDVDRLKKAANSNRKEVFLKLENLVDFFVSKGHIQEAKKILRVIFYFGTGKNKFYLAKVRYKLMRLHLFTGIDVERKRLSSNFSLNKVSRKFLELTKKKSKHNSAKIGHPVDVEPTEPKSCQYNENFQMAYEYLIDALLDVNDCQSGVLVLKDKNLYQELQKTAQNIMRVLVVILFIDEYKGKLKVSQKLKNRVNRLPDLPKGFEILVQHHLNRTQLSNTCTRLLDWQTIEECFSTVGNLIWIKSNKADPADVKNADDFIVVGLPPINLFDIYKRARHFVQLFSDCAIQYCETTINNLTSGRSSIQIGGNAGRLQNLLIKENKEEVMALWCKSLLWFCHCDRKVNLLKVQERVVELEKSWMLNNQVVLGEVKVQIGREAQKIKEKKRFEQAMDNEFKELCDAVTRVLKKAVGEQYFTKFYALYLPARLNYMCREMVSKYTENKKSGNTIENFNKDVDKLFERFILEVKEYYETNIPRLLLKLALYYFKHCNADFKLMMKNEKLLEKSRRTSRSMKELVPLIDGFLRKIFFLKEHEYKLPRFGSHYCLKDHPWNHLQRFDDKDGDKSSEVNCMIKSRQKTELTCIDALFIFAKLFRCSNFYPEKSMKVPDVLITAFGMLCGRMNFSGVLFSMHSFNVGRLQPDGKIGVGIIYPHVFEGGATYSEKLKHVAYLVEMCDEDAVMILEKVFGVYLSSAGAMGHSKGSDLWLHVYYKVFTQGKLITLLQLLVGRFFNKLLMPPKGPFNSEDNRLLKFYDNAKKNAENVMPILKHIFKDAKDILVVFQLFLDAESKFDKKKVITPQILALYQDIVKKTYDASRQLRSDAYGLVCLITNAVCHVVQDYYKMLLNPPISQTKKFYCLPSVLRYYHTQGKIDYDNKCFNLHLRAGEYDLDLGYYFKEKGRVIEVICSRLRDILKYEENKLTVGESLKTWMLNICHMFVDVCLEIKALCGDIDKLFTHIALMYMRRFYAEVGKVVLKQNGLQSFCLLFQKKESICNIFKYFHGDSLKNCMNERQTFFNIASSNQIKIDGEKCNLYLQRALQCSDFLKNSSEVFGCFSRVIDKLLREESSQQDKMQWVSCLILFVWRYVFEWQDIIKNVGSVIDAEIVFFQHVVKRFAHKFDQFLSFDEKLSSICKNLMNREGVLEKYVEAVTYGTEKNYNFLLFLVYQRLLTKILNFEEKIQDKDAGVYRLFNQVSNTLKLPKIQIDNIHFDIYRYCWIAKVFKRLNLKAESELEENFDKISMYKLVLLTTYQAYNKFKRKFAQQKNEFDLSVVRAFDFTKWVNQDGVLKNREKLEEDKKILVKLLAKNGALGDKDELKISVKIKQGRKVKVSEKKELIDLLCKKEIVLFHLSAEEVNCIFSLLKIQPFVITKSMKPIDLAYKLSKLFHRFLEEICENPTYKSSTDIMYMCKKQVEWYIEYYQSDTPDYLLIRVFMEFQNVFSRSFVERLRTFKMRKCVLDDFANNEWQIVRQLMLLYKWPVDDIDIQDIIYIRVYRAIYQQLISASSRQDKKDVNFVCCHILGSTHNISKTKYLPHLNNLMQLQDTFSSKDRELFCSFVSEIIEDIQCNVKVSVLRNVFTLVESVVVFFKKHADVESKKNFLNVLNGTSVERKVKGQRKSQLSKREKQVRTNAVLASPRKGGVSPELAARLGENSSCIFNCKYGDFFKMIKIFQKLLTKISQSRSQYSSEVVKFCEENMRVFDKWRLKFESPVRQDENVPKFTGK